MLRKRTVPAAYWSATGPRAYLAATWRLLPCRESDTAARGPGSSDPNREGDDGSPHGQLLRGENESELQYDMGGLTVLASSGLPS